ncbi:MAG: hypothetical protein IKZ86_10800 [Spirochaetaceae bacterium]|nr:hypothetical protein [Spirochaetaceae bacterium]
MKTPAFAILLAIILTCALVSCGGGGGGGGSAPATTDSSSTNTTTTTSTSTSSTSTSTTTTTYYGTKAPTEAKAVGDIVFSDGSATSYSSGLSLTDAQKSAAIAMIFYKGTECSNDGSTRTLGVGLKRSASTMQWCRWSSDSDCANGYDTNITTIRVTSHGSTGAYTFSGYKDGSNNLSQIATVLAGSNDTETAGNYPAFEYAKNYGSTNGCIGSYASGWYLPSIAELFQIWKERANINAVVVLCGLTNTFSSTEFWSSSMGSSQRDFASRLDFDNGGCADISKRYNRDVCAVRAF